MKNSKEKVDARIPQDQVAALYDRLARVYDGWAALTESRALSRALEHAPISDGQIVLEVAAGTGLAFSEIARRNPRGLSVGIDLSRKMLRKAKRRLLSLPEGSYVLVRGTAYTLPMRDESVDILINSYMFDLVPFSDMPAILEEFRRVLRKSGHLVLVSSSVGDGWADRLYDAVYRSFPKIVGGCRRVDLGGRLQECGFTILHRERYRQMFLSSEVIAARR